MIKQGKLTEFILCHKIAVDKVWKFYGIKQRWVSGILTLDLSQIVNNRYLSPLRVFYRILLLLFAL